MKLKLNNKAQVVAELSVFGFILIFILGAMLRYAINDTLSQRQRLQAMRLALGMSFNANECQIIGGCVGGEIGSGRNVASVLFVEDRLTPEANKYGAISRTPYVTSAAGSMSKNLFMPNDFGIEAELPIMDIYINSPERAMTFHTADYAEYSIAGAEPCISPGALPGCVILRTVVANGGPSSSYDPGCADCFDLDGDGTPEPVPDPAAFSWQWQDIEATTENINLQSGQNISLDVDNDTFEEVVLEYQIEGGQWFNAQDDPPDRERVIIAVRVLDFQEGDIDLSDPAEGPGSPGLQQDVRMLSFTMEGTSLTVVEQGTTKTATQQKNRVDVVERIINLSNNKPDMCARNSIALCNGGCNTGNNQFQTCYDPGSRTLFVRSRIGDTRSRTWRTDYGALQ